MQVANISAAHANQRFVSKQDQCGFPQYGSFDDTANGERELTIEFTTPEIVHSERSLEVELRTSLNAEGRVKYNELGVTGSASPRFWGLERFQVTTECISTRLDCSADVPQGFIAPNRMLFGCGPDGNASNIDDVMGTAFARWHAKNWDGRTLPDSSGYYRHASSMIGSVSAANASGFGATAPQHYIYGSLSDKLFMPTNSLPTAFTLCSLSRYTDDGGAKGRIIAAGPQSGSPNFLHGHHHSGLRGVAHYNTWKTPQSDLPGHSDLDWLVMCGKNVANGGAASILADGVPRNTGTAAGNGGGQLNINGFSNEVSNWAVGHILVWDRHLSDEDMAAVSEMMMRSLHNADIDLASCSLPLSERFVF